jgi:glycosyltransferase involved in cell wall biosynthesis
MEKKLLLTRPKVIVVLPAYNAEKTLRQTVEDIPRDYIDEVILVDDHSCDRTFEVARAVIKKLATGWRSITAPIL